MTDAAVTVKLVGGIPGMEKFPELTEHIGRWLLRYDPDKAISGEQWLWTTDKRSEALALPFKEMLDLIKKPIGVRPWDGKPDRPISAFHLSITRFDVEDTL
jgi:hypothetical protein